MAAHFEVVHAGQGRAGVRGRIRDHEVARRLLERHAPVQCDEAEHVELDLGHHGQQDAFVTVDVERHRVRGRAGGDLAARGVGIRGIDCLVRIHEVEDLVRVDRVTRLVHHDAQRGHRRGQAADADQAGRVHVGLERGVVHVVRGLGRALLVADQQHPEVHAGEFEAHAADPGERAVHVAADFQVFHVRQRGRIADVRVRIRQHEAAGRLLERHAPVDRDKAEYVQRHVPFRADDFAFLAVHVEGDRLPPRAGQDIELDGREIHHESVRIRAWGLHCGAALHERERGLGDRHGRGHGHQLHVLAGQAAAKADDKLPSIPEGHVHLGIRDSSEAGVNRGLDFFLRRGVGNRTGRMGLAAVVQGEVERALGCAGRDGDALLLALRGLALSHRDRDYRGQVERARVNRGEVTDVLPGLRGCELDQVVLVVRAAAFVRDRYVTRTDAGHTLECGLNVGSQHGRAGVVGNCGRSRGAQAERKRARRRGAVGRDREIQKGQVLAGQGAAESHLPVARASGHGGVGVRDAAQGIEHRGLYRGRVRVEGQCGRGVGTALVAEGERELAGASTAQGDPLDLTRCRSALPNRVEIHVARVQVVGDGHVGDVLTREGALERDHVAVFVDRLLIELDRNVCGRNAEKGDKGVADPGFVDERHAATEVHRFGGAAAIQVEVTSGRIRRGEDDVADFADARRRRTNLGHAARDGSGLLPRRVDGDSLHFADRRTRHDARLLDRNRGATRGRHAESELVSADDVRARERADELYGIARIAGAGHLHVAGADSRLPLEGGRQLGDDGRVRVARHQRNVYVLAVEGDGERAEGPVVEIQAEDRVLRGLATSLPRHFDPLGHQDFEVLRGDDQSIDADQGDAAGLGLERGEFPRRVRPVRHESESEVHVREREPQLAGRAAADPGKRAHATRPDAHQVDLDFFTVGQGNRLDALGEGELSVDGEEAEQVDAQVSRGLDQVALGPVHVQRHGRRGAGRDHERLRGVVHDDIARVGLVDGDLDGLRGDGQVVDPHKCHFAGRGLE